VPLHLAYVASAFFLEAIQRPMASTAIMWAANVVNLGLNLACVPRYGALGSAWATVGARLLLALGTALWILRMPDAARLDSRSHSGGPSYRELMRVGIAAALSQAAEAGAFSGMTMLAGRLGERAVAGYQIVLNFTAVVFMISLGVASATAVLTSEAEGRKAHGDAARAGFMGLALNTGLMAGITLIVLFVPGLLARAYTADVELALVLTGLFPLASIALSPDGAQTVAASALRARNDNWFPTASHLLAYAMVMPVLGYWLAEKLGHGVLGLVWAVLLSSVLSATVLSLRLWKIARRARVGAELAE
jgi:MATE family multidrug resistance protein